MPSKKVSLKLIDVYGLFIAIAETEKVNIKGIPFKLAWELADVKEALKKSAVRLEEERNKIFSELGTAKEDQPGNFEVAAENVAEINKRIKELNETVVEIEFTPISIGRIEAAKEFQFAPGAFEELRKHVIEFPVPKEKEKKEEVPA